MSNLQIVYELCGIVQLQAKIIKAQFDSLAQMGAVTLIGVLIANGKSQAVTEPKLDELTREVREHNNFARRMPVVEEQIKVINHRIEDLEEINKH